MKPTTLGAVLVVPFVLLPAALERVRANADSGWRVDLSARGVASVELDDRATMTRDAIVPAVGARVERRVGSLYVGGTFSAGAPAWYGKTDATISVDREHVLARPTCVLVANDFIGEQHCHGARWSIDVGVDAGIGLLYFDAPPETSPSSNALIYWGPLARGRVQLHVLGVLASARAVGLVVGVNTAITSARYSSTASGTGIRLESELELGVSMRL